MIGQFAPRNVNCTITGVRHIIGTANGPPLTWHATCSTRFGTADFPRTKYRRTETGVSRLATPVSQSYRQTRDPSQSILALLVGLAWHCACLLVFALKRIRHVKAASEGILRRGPGPRAKIRIAPN